MMRFKDYPIKVIEPETWFNEGKSEKTEETLLRINQWIEEHEHIVLNIETLFFPELDDTPGGTGSAIFKAGGGESKSEFYQVFRVWYKMSTPIASLPIDNLV